MSFFPASSSSFLFFHMVNDNGSSSSRLTTATVVAKTFAKTFSFSQYNTYTATIQFHCYEKCWCKQNKDKFVERKKNRSRNRKSLYNVETKLVLQYVIGKNKKRKKNNNQPTNRRNKTMYNSSVHRISNS